LRCREQNVFFRREMNSDFGLEMLRDFSLPWRQVGVGDGRGASDANTQGQSVLVLMGERN
jgi:hypothetical protein